MSRKMKRFFAMLAAVVMLGVISVAAFAEDNPETEAVTETVESEPVAEPVVEEPVADEAPAETTEDPAPAEDTAGTEAASANTEEEAPVEETPVTEETAGTTEEETPEAGTEAQEAISEEGTAPSSEETAANSEEPAATDGATTTNSEDDLTELDDWGYVDPEVIEENTPEMTQELIHQDDGLWNRDAGEGEDQPEETAEETETEPEVTETAETVEDPVNAETTETEETPENSENAETESAPVNTENAQTESAPANTENAAAETENTSKVTVTVTATMKSEREMLLDAVVNDPEGRDFCYQWQVSMDGGENYQDVENATESKLEVELTEENISGLWRVSVWLK